MNTVSLKPGSKQGLGIKRNYNVKPLKLGGGLGKKAPAKIAKALGVSIGMPVHQGAVKQLLSHPDSSVAKAAKKLLGKF